VVHSETGRIALVSKDASLFQFTKGKREPGERSRDAARREITEESGLIRVELGDILGTYIRQKGSEIFRVQMFVGSTDEDEARPQDPAYKCMQWFTLKAARRSMRFPSEIDFLDQFNDVIREEIEHILAVAR
jgi:8-oxo-dGTP pyrophosphatase MutT (NUDIX family)